MSPARRALSLGLATALAAPLALAVAAPPADGATRQARPLVSTFVSGEFGRVLSTPGKQALYYWNRERDGRVRCTGSCAVAWPPVIVPRGVAVPRRVAGIKGTFGVARRPDGRRQVTHNGRPVYAYANEGPRQVLCNDVDGWFVVRV